MRDMIRSQKLITSGNKTTPNVALMRSDSQIVEEKTPFKDTKILISEFDAVSCKKSKPLECRKAALLDNYI